MREAGDRTTWTDPDAAYEAAVHAAVDAAFDDPEVREVLDGLVARVAGPGWSNALSAKLVALTMPGVPDVYQGSELWEQSLVDPDNRRPVDFDRRRGVLGARRGRRRPRPRRPRRRRAREAAGDPVGADRCAATQPERFTTYRPVARGGRRGRPRRSPSTAAARSPSPPGCRSASSRAAAGATPRSSCPRALVGPAHRRRLRWDARRRRPPGRLPGGAAGPERPGRRRSSQ